MPMFHTNAQTYSMLSSLWVGATFVLQPKFSASRFWPLSLKHRLTWLSIIPFAAKAIASQPVPEHHYRFWGMGAHVPAFKQAFNVDTITSKEAAFALAQFERTMISGNSKWDRYLRGEEMLTQAESQGFEVFFTEKGDCFYLKTVDDREVIRPNALGNFGDLLWASAHSPAMLI